jgi:hypothetical protein
MFVNGNAPPPYDGGNCGKPASIADLERLEADIEEALISYIDKPADHLIIADLERRKLHLIREIERLRPQYCVTSLH